MNFFTSIIKTIDQAAAQLTTSSPKPKSIYFTSNFQQKAKQWGLSEKDALDVYYHGEETKAGRKVRKYNGYELSIRVLGHFLSCTSRVRRVSSS